jgi:hypothetical protein
MTDIEPKEVFRQKAIDLINEYRVRGGVRPIQFLEINTPEVSAFIRSIQLHEATDLEFSGFKQLVSDAAEKAIDHIKNGRLGDALLVLDDLTIPKPKPDPLEDVAKSLGYYNNTAAKHWAGDVRAALDAAGYEIREKNDD